MTSKMMKKCRKNYKTYRIISKNNSINYVQPGKATILRFRWKICCSVCMIKKANFKSVGCRRRWKRFQKGRGKIYNNNCKNREFRKIITMCEMYIYYNLKIILNKNNENNENFNFLFYCFFDNILLIISSKGIGK